jgi:hypothetical protein
LEDVPASGQADASAAGTFFKLVGLKLATGLTWLIQRDAWRGKGGQAGVPIGYRLTREASHIYQQLCDCTGGILVN